MWRRFLAHPGVALAAVAALGAVCAVLLIRPGLRRDYRLEAFVAGRSEAYERFRAFSETFGSNELAMITVTNPGARGDDAAAGGSDALSPETRAIVHRIAESARDIPQVEHLSALTELPALFAALPPEQLRRHPLVEGNLLSRDGRTAAIVLHMRGEGGGGSQRREAVRALRAVVTDARVEFPDASILIAGPYVTLIDMYAYVERDLLVFSAAAFALLAITLWVVFRRWAPVVYAAGGAVVAAIAPLALAAAIGLNASLIVQMIVILVTVLAIAGAVHLAVHAEERAAADPEAPPWRQVEETLRRMWPPCLVVVATTVVGFGSVIISDLTPVRMFGYLMVVGLLVGFVLSIALLPTVWWGIRYGARNRGTPDKATRSLDGRGDPSPSRDREGAVFPNGSRGAGALGEGPPRDLGERLEGVARFAQRHPRGVVLGFVVATVLLSLKIPDLHFESDFVKNFRADGEVRRAYAFIEEHLTPLGVVEVVVRRTDGGTVVTADTLARIRTFSRRAVEEFEPIRKAIALSDVLAIDGQLPTSDWAARMRLAGAAALVGESTLRQFVTADRTALRINLRAAEGYDVGEKLRMSAALQALAQEVFGPQCAVEVTGLYDFYARLVDGLVRDQYRSFGITLVGVFLALCVASRSLRVATAALIPNLLPVLWCVGLMAWCTIPVNMTTAMMLAVTLGIAVDDTVHYLWRCRREFMECGCYETALRATHRSVGRACLFTTIVIAGGFWILTLSRFLPTAYFGGLVGATMLGALAADLLLLPVLIVRWRLFGPEGAGRERQDP
jgi:hypothetical protein